MPYETIRNNVYSIQTIDTHLYYEGGILVVAAIRIQMNQVSGGFFSAQKQEETRLYFEDGQTNKIQLVCNQYEKPITLDTYLAKHWELLQKEVL